MTYRTSPAIALADREAAERSIDATSPASVTEASRARWSATHCLSCGHATTDGLRENEHGQLGCAKLNCDGLVIGRAK